VVGLRRLLERSTHPGGGNSFSRWPSDKLVPIGCRNGFGPPVCSELADAVDVVVLSIVVGIFVIMTIVGFVDWHRSQSVQHGGLRATGIVTQVHAIEHSTRYGSYHTYNLDVALLPPQLGHTATTVHTPDRSPPADIGDTVTVLLDRSDAGYAELPGQPANSIDTAIVGLVFLLLIGGVFLWAGIRHRRVRRAASVATG
jgi:hypothetical protein